MKADILTTEQVLELDRILENLMDDYCKKKGIDPLRLDLLTEKEYQELLVDSQIEAYLKGKMDSKGEVYDKVSSE